MFVSIGVAQRHAVIFWARADPQVLRCACPPISLPPPWPLSQPQPAGQGALGVVKGVSLSVAGVTVITTIYLPKRVELLIRSATVPHSRRGSKILWRLEALVKLDRKKNMFCPRPAQRSEAIDPWVSRDFSRRCASCWDRKSQVAAAAVLPLRRLRLGLVNDACMGESEQQQVRP
jgi:hypothetical protein